MRRFFFKLSVLRVSYFSIFAAFLKTKNMRYSELEKKLKKAGCYLVSNKAHPIWYSPITGKHFQTGHHKSEEVKKGTLDKILKLAGIK